MSYLWLQRTFFLLACIQTSIAQDWCDFSSIKCSTTDQVLTNLSCGWCRSWTFASNIANNKLRMVGLDGGALPGDGDASHNYMVEASLDQEFDLTDGNAWKMSLLPSSVPLTKGGALWSNTSNSTVLNYGGHAPGSTVPNGTDIASLDTSSDQWSTVSTLISIQRLTNGASIDVAETGKAYYIGGWRSNVTSSDSPGDGLMHYSTSVVQLDTSTNAPSLINSPFLPVQFGAASYIPVGGGALLYFGGESPPTASINDTSTCTVNSWDHVWVYDIIGDKWYRQNTTGNAPPRTEFCATTSYDAASKSWQIWAIGGADFKTQEVTDTVSVLSVPSFQWFNASAAVTRMSIDCQRFGSQVFVIGGRTEDSAIGGSDYNSIAYIYDMNKQASVSTFAPTSTSYAPPASVQTAISATSTPATWADPAVRALFMSSTTTSVQSSATTTTTATSTPSSSPASSAGLSGGAIGGIVVGVVLGLALIAGLVFFLVRQRRKQNIQQVHHQPSTPFMMEKPELDAQGIQQWKKSRPVPAEMSGVNDGVYPYREMDGSGATRSELPAERESAVWRVELEGRTVRRG